MPKLPKAHGEKAVGNEVNDVVHEPDFYGHPGLEVAHDKEGAKAIEEDTHRKPEHGCSGYSIGTLRKLQ